jgi:thiamine biosynthesis lipoprotein ApbE
MISGSLAYNRLANPSWTYSQKMNNIMERKFRQNLNRFNHNKRVYNVYAIPMQQVQLPNNAELSQHIHGLLHTVNRTQNFAKYDQNFKEYNQSSKQENTLPFCNELKEQP